jgi:2-keto-4-pentenoate hydratase/2-oxohepta-3-ene-1,7-dioic acid hydratase in catechol pathway
MFEDVLKEYPSNWPRRIYGFGLTYRGHIKETTCIYDNTETPPVFMKSAELAPSDSFTVTIPNEKELLEKVEEVERGLAKKLTSKLSNLKDCKGNSIPLRALVDFEIELAVILMDDIDWDRLTDDTYAVKVGYFLANDLSARSVAILGEGKPDCVKYRFWGESKSFPGFLPVGSIVRIPKVTLPDSFICTTLTCTLQRPGAEKGTIPDPLQSDQTENCIYTIKKMLAYIEQAKSERGYPEELPRKGDIILTGTPKGVAIGRVEKYKKCFADFANFDGLKRLAKVLNWDESHRKKGESLFLKPDDILTVQSDKLGKFTISFESGDQESSSPGGNPEK